MTLEVGNIYDCRPFVVFRPLSVCLFVGSVFLVSWRRGPEVLGRRAGVLAPDGVWKNRSLYLFHSHAGVGYRIVLSVFPQLLSWKSSVLRNVVAKRTTGGGCVP